MRLNDKLIAIYESDYKKNSDRRTALIQLDAETAKKLKTAAKASMVSWDEAVATAHKYFASSEFKAAYVEREKGATEINEALNAPDYDFDKNSWYQFYRISALGQLDGRSRSKIWKYQKRLKNGLRKLVTGRHDALPSVLNSDGQLHVPGAGLNTISKILASHEPGKWLVYNSRVALALADFGYKHPHGATTADKYTAYRNIIEKFAEACADKGSPRPDAFALDAFFFMRSQIRKKAKKKARLSNEQIALRGK
jgi:hypothetical protein